MATSTVTVQGETFTFKGRPMTHAIVVTVEGQPRPTVWFAGSIEKAQREVSATENRVATVKRGETLRGCYSTDWHRRVVNIELVPVSHS